MTRRLLPLLLVVAAGCAQGGAPPPLHTAQWGDEGRALLGMTDRGLATFADCGAVIDCGSTDLAPPAAAAATTSDATDAASAGASDDPDATPATAEARTPAAATPAPTPEPVAVATSGDDPCGTIEVLSLEGKGSLSPAETVCLQATAEGRRSAPDPEIQVAAVTLYNTRAGGWPAAVEAALKRPALKNAPALSFAGIKPAYDQGRYSTVLRRTRTVWRNLDKGYQLSGSDKTFVTEFACRSAGQLALSGNPPDDGLDWCERWLDRAERAGQDTGPIENLIDQLE